MQEASPSPFFPLLPRNAFGSPSWTGYVGGQRHDRPLHRPDHRRRLRTVTPTGDTGGVTSVNAGQIEVTSFNSWEGNANPTGAFANELGNRLHFGLVVVSTTDQFDLRDVSFDITSNDASNSSGYTGDLLEHRLPAPARRIGLSYGADGIKGTSDDVLYSNGAGGIPGSDTSLINVLYYVGVGNAEWPGGNDPDPSHPLLGAQGAIDDTNSYIYNNISQITGSYTINVGGGSVTGAADVSVAPLPSAASMGLGLTAVIGVSQLLRKKLRSA